jgi:hypothetical protein
MPTIREVQEGDWCVRLDLDGQVLKVDIPDIDILTDDNDSDSLFPTPPLTQDSAVSAGALLLKAKQFDDGLMAAVDLAAQRGTGSFRGKAPLLRALAGNLADPFDEAERTAAAIVFAACELGGIPAPTPPPLHAEVRAWTQQFLSDEGKSKPIGFYTWTPQLTAICRQDRFLQEGLPATAATAIARALDRIPDGWDSYDRTLRLASRMTNPLDSPGLRDDGDPRVFLPPSRSREVSLFERMVGDRPIPEGFDLMTELIHHIRKGGASPVPNDEAGWYERQTWSLEPLVIPDRMPESPRLDLGQRYRRHLEDLFRGALALARETHAKQLMGGRGGYAGVRRPPICVHPALTVEPLPSMYRRRAACYRFVHSVVAETFGAEALRQLHRLTPDGASDLSLSEELEWMEALFDGAAATSHRELGMGSSSDNDRAAGLFADWKSVVARDEDLSQDARMMVPVFFDLGRRKTKVWAVLGWRKVMVNVSFRVQPKVLEVKPVKPAEPDPGDRVAQLRRKFRKSAEPPISEPPEVLFTGEVHRFAVPVMAEVYVTRLLDRDEFRWHCDRFRTRSAILANLR